MRRALIFGGLVLTGLAGFFWATGALEGAGTWLQAAQRGAQERLAGAIRSLRGGAPGTLAAFWGLCFAYGVLHAAGPGHGKLVIGGYGVARRVPLARLLGLAFASSLAQAAVAVGLVYSLVAAFGLTRLAVEGTAERWMTPLSFAMIAGLGLWLVWRGVSGLRRQAGTAERNPVAVGRQHHNHHPHHHHDHDDHGPQCSHAHGPSLAEVERITSWRDALALVAGIAMRPCSGALFVLILTWQLGIALAGIAGAIVMGLGTALVTSGVAMLAVWTREGALAGLGLGRATRIIPWLELLVGGAIAFAALGLFLRTF